MFRRCLADTTCLWLLFAAVLPASVFAADQISVSLLVQGSGPVPLFGQRRGGAIMDAGGRE